MKKLTDKTSEAKTKKPSGASDKEENAILQFALESVRRWWQICFPVGAVIAAVACFVVWFFFEPVYEAKSLIRIANSQPGLLKENSSRRGNSRGFVDDQKALIKSQIVLETVLANADVLTVPELQSVADQERQLSRMVGIRSGGGSQLFYITAQCKSAEDAKLLCDRVVEAYFLERETYETELETELLNLLEKEGLRSESSVADLERELRLLHRQKEQVLNAQLLNSVDVNSDDPLNDSVIYIPLIDLQVSYELKKLERLSVMDEIDILTNEIADDIVELDEDAVALAIEDNSRIQQLEQRITEDEILYESMTEHAADHPEKAAVRRRIENSIRLVAITRAQLEEEIRTRMGRSTRKSRRQRLASLQGELLKLEADMETLNDKIKTHSETIAEANDQALSIEFKREEISRAKSIRDQLRSRVMTIRTERMAPERITRLDREGGARVPVAPVEILPTKKLVLAACACFIAPFGIAFLWELRMKRVSSGEQLEKQVNQRIVGEVAVLPTKANTQGKSSSRRVEKQFRLFEESVDSLRTLFTVSTDQNYELVSITSAIPNEGKTTIASQLAISLGRVSNEPVLLIDADVRAPDVHYVFGVENEVGLVDVLLNESSLDDAIQSVLDENVHILPAGELRGESPHRVLDPVRLEKLIDELRSKYSRIVFDTSPALSSSESLHVSRCCDATIVSVMRDVSRLDQIRKVSERLESAGVNMAGMVLSGVPQYRYSYSYGAYGDYA